MHTLSVGLPSQLLQNRPDIRQAERELAAAGLDVKVARVRFFPLLTITAGVGYEAFNPRYLFITPEALIANVAGDLVAPLINKKAIKADYLSANARQLQSVYNYQRVKRLIEVKWRRPGSNRQPPGCKPGALPIELRPRADIQRAANRTLPSGMDWNAARSLIMIA